MNSGKSEARVVVYYNMSDIILGFALIILSTFFALYYFDNKVQDNPNCQTATESNQ